MRKRVVFVTVLFVGVALCLGLLVYRTFFLRTVRVPTSNMMNTILPGDQLFIKKLLSDPKRGQVVLYSYPGDKESYLGRVIGLPRESIQLINSSVLINGKQLDEERVIVGAEGLYAQQLDELSHEGSGPYRVYYGPQNEEPYEQTFGVLEPYTISDKTYFILGDNRDNSNDSRFRGTVPGELIWGTASIIYWSDERGGEVRWNRIGKSVH